MACIRVFEVVAHTVSKVRRYQSNSGPQATVACPVIPPFHECSVRSGISQEYASLRDPRPILSSDLGTGTVKPGAGNGTRILTQPP